MGSSSHRRASNSLGINFGIGENQSSSHGEALNRIESLFREAGEIIRDIYLEEEWEGGEASQCVGRLWCKKTSSRPTVRAGQFSSQLKRRKTEFVKFLEENQRSSPVQDGAITLGSDVK